MCPVHVLECESVCFSRLYLQISRVNLKAFAGTSEHTRLRAGGKEGGVKGGGSGEKGAAHPAP